MNRRSPKETIRLAKQLIAQVDDLRLRLDEAPLKWQADNALHQTNVWLRQAITSLSVAPEVEVRNEQKPNG